MITEDMIMEDIPMVTDMIVMTMIMDMEDIATEVYYPPTLLYWIIFT